MIEEAIGEAVKSAAPKVIEEAYSDTVSNTLKEVSKIGVDAAKTIRLLLLPLQYTAALQDRLAQHIDKSLRKVPPENRIAPVESVALPVCERLRCHPPESDMANLYINLLARSMDKERVSEAHPAFVEIISQLAPDEARFIEVLSPVEFAVIGRESESREFFLEAEANQAINTSFMPAQVIDFLNESYFKHSEIQESTLFDTFLEHLHSLGLVEYSNDTQLQRINALADPQIRGKQEYFAIRLTRFGRLFHSACISESNGNTELL